MAPFREPREEAIVDVTSITNLPREDAIRWLRAYDNDANKAVDAFFENPNAILDQQSQVKYDEQQGQVRWNEDEFHIDKTDDIQHGTNQFGVRPTNTLGPGIFNDSAPSRPPSRVGARELTVTNGTNQDDSMQSEDEQMRRVMAISMSDSQNIASQEMGVLTHKSFGPATREHYETEKWAMTVTGPQTQEILLNPEPADRKRPNGAPAFLKPSPAGQRLPALLKILHAIPMAREALLNRTCTIPDYGHEKDWWDGTAIKSLRIINLDLEGRQVNTDEIVHESQRLMAFLDATERAYGSTEVLARLDVIGDPHNDKIIDFYTGWYDATFHSVPDAPLLDIFASIGTKTSKENPQSETFCCLVARVDDEISGKGLTLYEVLDHMLWSDHRDDEETFFEKVGDIFTLEVSNLVPKNPGLGVEVPATWYADRYLPSSTKQAQDMLYRKAKVCAERDAREKAQANMTNYTSVQNTASIDASQLLSRATAYLEQTANYQDAVGNLSDTIMDLEDDANGSKHHDELAQELRALSEKLSQKMETFDKVRECAHKQLKEISQMYTQPSGNPDQPPHCKYTLRGVSTNPHNVYVLERTAPEDDGDLLSSEAKDWQWWRIEFLSSDTSPVVYEKVTEGAVLQAASTQSASVLLVYASEAAVTYKVKELPQQLYNFVRADNLSFHKELEETTCLRPATPIKRKVHDNKDDEFHSPQIRSSPYATDLSKKTSDSNPPGYYSSASPSALSHQGTASHEGCKTGSFDDVIPTSLQSRDPTFNHDSSQLDQERINDGQEMQERNSGQSLLGAQKDRQDQYALGSYVPDIDIEDEDDDADQTRTGRE